MARTKIVLNRRGVRDLLLSRGVERNMSDRADNVASEARRLAPVDTGRYKASIDSETHKGRNRWTGRAIADIEYAQTVEAAHRVLGRAIDSQGEGSGLVRYTTKAGKTRWATQAQVDNWTRGGG